MTRTHIESLWHTPTRLTAERRTAIHEAGHATACFKLLGGLDVVSIVGGEDYNGYTKSKDEDSQEHFLSLPAGKERGRLAKRCTMLLCGPAAVEKVLGTLQHEHVKNDIADLQQLLYTVAETQEELDLFTDRCWQQARRLVRKEWGAIKALAAALMETKTLSGEEVGKIIGQRNG